MKRLVVSFLIADKAGFVEQLSRAVKQVQGNWQQSCMQQMSGYFAGAVELQVAKEHSAQLIEQIKDICLQQCHIVEIEPKAQAELPSITLNLTANDRVGIIQDITAIIHQQKGNLIKLTSKQTNAPHTGQLMFLAKAKIHVAPEQVSQLVTALEHLADDLMVDVHA